MTGTAHQQQLARVAKRHGAREFALRIIIEADRTDTISKSLALALIEHESAFHNCYGHDPVANPVKSPPGGLLTVTKTNWARYKRHRDAGEGQQGAGPGQLTATVYQDAADNLGGCWIARHNIRVALDTLDGLVGKHGVRRGLAAYNAGEGGMHAGGGFDYADAIIKAQQTWHQRLVVA